MILLEESMVIKGLKRQGLTIREIARRTGRSRNTVTTIADNVVGL